MPEYTVVAVNDVREWKGKHGDFVDYILDLEGHGPQVTLTQKPETPEPARGDVLFGDIQILERTNRKGEPFTVHKFSKEQREPNGQTQVPHGFKPGVELNRPTPVRDERGARIERQHSQEMALRYIELLPVNASVRNPANLSDTVVFWTDFFVNDLNKASAAGQVDSLPPGSSEVAEGDTRGEPPAPLTPAATSHGHIPPSGSSAGAAEGKGRNKPPAPSQTPSEPPSQAQTATVSPDTRAKITVAYKGYVASAPDGPAAKQELQLFLNANDIPGFEAMSEAQASMVMAFFDDAGGSADDSVPF